MRGLSLALIPPTDPSRQDEFKEFQHQMKRRIHVLMPLEHAQQIPDPQPLRRLCTSMQLETRDVMVRVDFRFLKPQTLTFVAARVRRSIDSSRGKIRLYYLPLQTTEYLHR